MRDQAVALEWVQENIHLFGGDRGQVLLQKMIVVVVVVVLSALILLLSGSSGDNIWRKCRRMVSVSPTGNIYSL